MCTGVNTLSIRRPPRFLQKARSLVRTTHLFSRILSYSQAMMFSRGHAAKFVLIATGQAIRANAECAFRVGEFVGSVAEREREMGQKVLHTH